MGVQSQNQGVPARSELMGFLPSNSVRISPLDIDAHRPALVCQSGGMPDMVRSLSDGFGALGGAICSQMYWSSSCCQLRQDRRFLPAARPILSAT